MSKTTLDKPAAQSAMFFSPSHRRYRRLQLQISERRLLLMLGDMLAVSFAILISLRIWAWVARYDFTIDFILPQLYLFVLLMGVWLLLAGAADLYDLRIAASRNDTFQRLVLINVVMTVLYVLIFFFSPRDALPRLFIIYYAVVSVLTIGVWRYTRPVLMGWVGEPRRVLIIGADRSAEVLISAIRAHAPADYDIKGIIGAPADVGHLVEGVSVVGAGEDLMNFVARDRITELVITSTVGLPAATFRAVMDAYERGISLVPMSLLYERITGRVPVEHVSDDWAVVLLPMQNDSPGFQLYALFKRVYDVVLSLLGLVIFLLLLPFLALAVRFDSRGPIFYTQARVGRNGRPFRIIKFRSMVVDAEAQTGAIFSRRGDPRVTRVGRIMRRTRLDELPQFINVLRGEMSLVGPRPERPEHVARLTEKIPFYRTRLIVRPGLSGWAQVRYNYGENDEDALVKLQYDLYYIRHQSLWLDLNILIRTAAKALAFRGV